MGCVPAAALAVGDQFACHPGGVVYRVAGCERAPVLAGWTVTTDDGAQLYVSDTESVTLISRLSAVRDETAEVAGRARGGDGGRRGHSSDGAEEDQCISCGQPRRMCPPAKIPAPLTKPCKEEYHSMAEPSHTNPAATAITVTAEPARGETTFREAMQAATSAVAGLANRALSAPTSYARHTASEAAQECLRAMRADLEAASGHDRWIAISAATEVGDKLRDWERRARQQGYGVIAQEFHEQLEECERTRTDLLSRSRSRGQDNGRARAM